MNTIKGKRAYSAGDIRRWIINLAKSGKLKWTTAGVIVLHWIQTAHADNRNIKECVVCKDLITNGVYLNMGGDREIPCCLNCTLQGVFVRLDKYLNGTAEPLDLENARDAMREILMRISPVTEISSQPNVAIASKTNTVPVHRH